MGPPYFNLGDIMAQNGQDDGFQMSATDDTTEKSGGGVFLVRGLLLFFVVGSLGYMLVRGDGEGSSVPLTPPSSVVPAGVTPGVIVYFFDADIRCTSCARIETFTYRALETRFAEGLASGAIAWQVLNTDRSENEHYLDKYRLYSKSIVLVEMKDGKEVRFENLEKIWNLVDDEDLFVGYIEERISVFLEGVS